MKTPARTAFRALASFALLALATACTDSPTDPVVEPTPPAAIRIAPADLSLADGGSSTLTVEFLDSAGAVIQPRPSASVTWSSSNAGVASVDSSGKVVAQNRGSAVVTAVAGDLRAQARVTVTATATRLEYRAGSGQRGTVGTALPNKVSVVVLDRHGAGVAGVRVDFRAETGGSLAPAQATTDQYGYAEAVWTLGPTAGDQTVRASVAGLNVAPVYFRASALAAAASRIVIASGDAQSAEVTRELAFPLVVRALDAFGNVVRDVPVNFAVVEGSASLVPSGTQTDIGGHVNARVTFGTVAGPVRVRARSAGLPDLVFSATARPGAIASYRAEPATPFSLAVGRTATFTVTALDQHGNVVPVRFNYVSQDPAVATVSQAGLVTAVAAGSTTVWAEYEGAVRGAVTVTVQ